MPRPFPPHLTAAIKAIAERPGRIRPAFPARRHPAARLDDLKADAQRRTVATRPSGDVLPPEPDPDRRGPGDRGAALRRASAPSSPARRPCATTAFATLPEDPASAPIHVLIPARPSNRASRGFARIERTWRMPDAVPLHGRPAGAPATCPLRRDALRAGPGAHARGLLGGAAGEPGTAEQLEEEFRLGQRKWTGPGPRAVREFRTGSASAPEAEFRAGWELAACRRCCWNASLYTPDGLHSPRPTATTPPPGWPSRSSRESSTPARAGRGASNDNAG